jgi:hypothetical protein
MHKTLLLVLLFGNTLLINAQISNANLLAHYKLDGTGADSSGNDLHGFDVNITSTTDRFGNSNGACYFNGTNAYISVARNSILEPSDSISITAWVYQVEKSNVGWYPVVCKRYSRFNDPFDSYGISTWKDTTLWKNKWIFDISSGTTGSQKITQATESNPFEEWTFISATYNKSQSELSIYINGQLDSTINTNINLGYSSMPLYIGFNGVGPDEYFKGKIDDLRIYGRVLSATEIATLAGISTGIVNPTKESDGITLYPNPANKTLRIAAPANFNNATIYDMYGKELIHTADLHTIDVSDFRKGYYIIELTDNDGMRVTKRFLIN